MLTIELKLRDNHVLSISEKSKGTVFPQYPTNISLHLKLDQNVIMSVNK